MVQAFTCLLLPHPTQLNTKLGRPYFPMQNQKPQNHKTTTKTVSHFISAPTQPNSTKFSIQPYYKIKNEIYSTKFSMPPYFNLNWKIHAQNNNQFCSTPTKIEYKTKTNSMQNKNKFNTKQKQSNWLWHSSG